MQEYWIVDPDRNSVRVFRRDSNGSFPSVAELSRSELLVTPLLPGLEIRLNELFA